MQANPLSNTTARNVTSAGHPSVSEGVGLAHDAGNLLGAFDLYCDLLNLPGVLRPEHSHYGRELRLLSQRSCALIRRLLEGLDGSAAALSPLRSKRLHPVTVVRAFAPLLRSLAAPDATVSMTVARGLPALPFAGEVLERILVNLTRNAATAMRSHGLEASEGRIHIGFSSGAGGLRLTVTDNGPGMTPAMVMEFLKPIPRSPGALRGLGHRVIHDLVASTNGQLSIESEPGRGTSLRIDWPIVPVRTGRRKCSGKIYSEGTDLSC